MKKCSLPTTIVLGVLFGAIGFWTGQIAVKQNGGPIKSADSEVLTNRASAKDGHMTIEHGFLRFNRDETGPYRWGVGIWDCTLCGQATRDDRALGFNCFLRGTSEILKAKKRDRCNDQTLYFVCPRCYLRYLNALDDPQFF